MKSKECFNCNETKLLTEFYKHSTMKGGFVNKCKSCSRAYTRNYQLLKSENPDWVKQERERNRLKYYRLGYVNKKPNKDTVRNSNISYVKKYPEKKKASNACKGIIKLNPSNQNHHWSYNEEHWKDVIELSIKEHHAVHRHMKYDQEFFMYRTVEGLLLDTRLQHEGFIARVLEFEKNTQ